jgi:hypothetical protein
MRGCKIIGLDIQAAAFILLWTDGKNRISFGNSYKKDTDLNFPRGTQDIFSNRAGDIDNFAD